MTVATLSSEMAFYICPNCKERSIDSDGLESLLDRQMVGCHRCGFGFLFELMEDYYPAPNTIATPAPRQETTPTPARPQRKPKRRLA